MWHRAGFRAFLNNHNTKGHPGDPGDPDDPDGPGPVPLTWAITPDPPPSGQLPSHTDW
jgi:hypothetical protein